LLFYETAEDGLAQAAALYPAHKVRLDEFHGRGALLMVGTFADPQHDGSMAIFTTRDAAEEFARGDPFVVNGVVARWRVLEWNEVLTTP
jgi:uncharacterized protein YciI